MLEPCELVSKDSQVFGRCVQKVATALVIPVNHWTLHKFNSGLFFKSHLPNWTQDDGHQQAQLPVTRILSHIQKLGEEEQTLGLNSSWQGDLAEREGKESQRQLQGNCFGLKCFIRVFTLEI